MHWSDRLVELESCEEAVRWCVGLDSFAEAWRICERGDWMLWLLGLLSGPPNSESRRKLVGVCGQCAELALHLFEEKYPSDDRFRKAVQACKDHAAGKIDAQECCTDLCEDDFRDTPLVRMAVRAVVNATYVSDACTATPLHAARSIAFVTQLVKAADIVRMVYPTEPNLS